MRRSSGCLFGLAFGDALGAVTEFLYVDEILHRFRGTAHKSQWAIRRG